MVTEQSDNSKWLSMAVTKKSPGRPQDSSGSGGIDGPGLDVDMLALQECFDGVTRATSAIKRLATELVKQGRTSNSSDLAHRGLQLCKGVLPSQDKVELMMLMPKENLKRA